MNLRPYREDDFDAVLELMNAHQLAGFGEADVTADDLRRWLTTPYVDSERDIRLAEDAGRLVGYADVDEARSDPPRFWCDVKVDPEAPAGPVLDALIAWIEERTDGAALRVWLSASDERLLTELHRHGFEPARHSYRMEIDLSDDVREPTWPEGISVRAAKPDELREVYEHVVEVWRDTNDPVDETYEEWAHWHVDRPDFDPALWHLAVAGDEVAGFSICSPDPVRPATGHVPLLGVRTPWRQQGLGEALLLHSFADFRRRAWTHGTLGVDASSPTGALRLYERVGMHAYRDTVFLDRPPRG